jgi:hypothetical protein
LSSSHGSPKSKPILGTTFENGKTDKAFYRRSCRIYFCEETGNAIQLCRKLSGNEENSTAIWISPQKFQKLFSFFKSSAAFENAVELWLKLNSFDKNYPENPKAVLIG